MSTEASWKLRFSMHLVLPRHIQSFVIFKHGIELYKKNIDLSLGIKLVRTGSLGEVQQFLETKMHKREKWVKTMRMTKDYGIRGSLLIKIRFNMFVCCL